jgi:coiled-coil domain-containing protein 130
MPPAEAVGVAVRIALPFDMFCSGCDVRLAYGTRFNARRTRDGEHLGLARWRLTFRCSFCGTALALRTDPAEGGYEVAAGRRAASADAHRPSKRKAAADDPAGDTTTEDAFGSLAKATGEARARAAADELLEQRLQYNRVLWKDDYAANAMLRKRFRQNK